ncbi:MAG TPA: PfkB family carbohydrate kinase [Burkholderiaceae bacterium]|nr:winged helix-turn-helix transcriptional regulator [Rhodoferax sp.]HQX59795.1 PfkB family carbohydrate kinase [Burkholderiaceae bacterium]HQZ04722.1 PfkB family carbohydrate kinase [Burkholderiaceae bacterium]
MTAREQEILDILRADPLIAQQALADRLGISRAAAAGHIMQLVRKGLVLGRGYVLAEQGFVLAIGAANMDITGDTPNAIVAHDSTPGRIRCAPGGVARNVAENLARLGDAVRLFSAVGDDLFGARLLESTRRAGVDVRDCLVLEEQATSTYLSIHGPDGDMALALNDMAILAQITPARLQASAALVRQARAVLVDCNLSDDALGWIFGQARMEAVFAEPVSAFKCRRLLPWLDRVHTLKANRLEAQALTGLPVDDDAGLVQATQWLHGKGVARVVLSLGARGAYWSERAGASGWQAALPADVVNATGAGDAMMAGLLHGYLQGEPLSYTIAFASACAAMTLAAPQANHVSLSVAAVRQQLQQAHAGGDSSPSSPDLIPTCS